MSADRDSRHRTPEFVREVRSRIWRWDPAHLVPLGVPEDEYDCLAGPVTGWLRKGLTADALAERLRRFVRSHFGIDASGTDEFARSIVSWYRTPEVDFAPGDIPAR